MTSIRVAVVAVPVMLREVLNQLLESAADIEIVNAPVEPGSDDDSAASPDVVLLANTGESDAACWKSLDANPRSSVLAVDRRGQHAFLFQLRRHKEALGEPSAEGLLAAIRRAATRDE